MTQQEAMKILKMGYNVCLTGSPGSGKTFLLNKYIDFLKKEGVKVGATASTGIAATHISGVTIHSWSGIGIKNEISQKDIQHLLKKRWLRKRLQNTKVLIIDEMSMLPAHRLDLVNQIIQAFKSNHFQPFGGIQVVLSGDFFQLPPVSKKNEPPSYFINHSRAWEEMGLRVCYLDEQWRQTDQEYLTVLNDIRTNSVSNQTVKLLQKQNRNGFNGSIKPPKFYTHNVDVEAENKRELAKIQTKSHRFIMESEGPEVLVNALKQSCLASEELVLKLNAPVLFLKNNFNKGYVNGTLGKVADFKEGEPIVKTTDKRYITVTPEEWNIEEDGVVKAKVTQLPLRLAWAITVHKSQGMNLDAAEIDLSRSFEPGMGYVALSRVRSLKGVHLKGFNDMAFQVNREALELDRQLQSLSRQVAKRLSTMPLQEQAKRQKEFLSSLGIKDKTESYSVNQIRQTHRSAYKKWTTEEEQTLIQLYQSGKTTKELAHILGRQQGGISSRLRRLKK
ncbi:MAG: AAA family ATPase [Candidatus Omnitrophota bacterium]